MNQMTILVFMVLFTFGKTSEERNIHDINQAYIVSDALKVFNFDELEAYLSKKDQNKTYVINFWATWCAPCVKELPYFEQLNTAYANQSVEVILVSLDFPKQIDTKLKPFLKKHKLESEVVVLDDIDSNTWIPKVNENWSGAIPATIIYNKTKKTFYERSFTYQELETELKQFIK
ncbi:AhpC/TSA family protein [Formosa sp. Hel1_31_208]|uniref:TlpA family protein disulfide reductase n=1 Tax=Formosa sp. Hel1_31_208 TaxID=1798225 RepID=UPI000879B4D8|nr:TlpA disulfide reductase family protein [Formosa sp. Hel1_31_208]SDS01528.1 AhpC/TSA family protein [Formosa sp. Hel1_31_208]